jgi:aminoglycoside phosphotransferase (APT) family kinase protein
MTMILTTRNLPTYLLSRGLISHDSVVDGDLTITDSSHRNRAFRVRRGAQPGYFVKQVRQWDAASISYWESEVGCYQRLSGNAIIPWHYATDFESRVLVLDLLADSETLSEYHKRFASVSALVGRKQGSVLSELHRTTQGAEEPGRIPWILSVHETDPAWFDSLSPANSRLLQIVQGYPEYCTLLSELRREWQPSCLIHGDVKWDNFLIRNTESPDPQLHLVDWEMAVFGDPRWDVGAVLQAYLNFWIYSMPFHETTQPNDLVIRARRPLEQLWPAIHWFWKTYSEEMRLDSQASRTMLTLSARYAAGRMIQSAFEMMNTWQQMPPAGAAMLQTSFNILTRPADAVRDLLGFTSE